MNDRILIIDDDDLVRSGLAANLTRAGFKIATASSGEEALEKIAVEFKMQETVLQSSYTMAIQIGKMTILDYLT